MAVITDNNLRHVRKTVTLDGSANNGNLGDTVPLFTITGRVLVIYAPVYVSVALACAAPTQTFLRLKAGTGHLWTLAGDGADFTGATGFFNGEAPSDVGGGTLSSLNAVAAAIGIYVTDSGGGADVTAGTIIVDIWYLPITNDGALAGDDIDTGYIPVNVAQISGDATAADRLESLMDGIVAGIVGTGSTTTSIANCTGFTEATNDHFNGRLITFLTGNLAGQQTQITDYTGSTQTFTCAALTEAPANTDTFVIS